MSSDVEVVEQNLALRRISNSEVNCFQTCKMRYFYEYVLNLEPRVLPGPLAIGIAGHKAQEGYWTAFANGEGIDSCVKAAESMLASLMRDGSVSGPDAMNLSRLMNLYASKWFADDKQTFDVAAIEKMYELPLTSHFTIPMRLDLLLKNKQTGYHVLRDFKFVFNFWDHDAHQFNPQFPKYMMVLGANNVQVSHAELDEIRHRSMRNPTIDDILRRTPYHPTRERSVRIMQDHIRVSHEIVAYRQQDEEAMRATTARNLNKSICKWCSFKELCMSDLDGGYTESLMRADYKQKTEYGYNNNEEGDL